MLICVIPTANAVLLTMNRKGIRTLAAETLGLPTSPYRFAATREEFEKAIAEVGIPCVVKPIMSSSGHGQSTIKSVDQIEEITKLPILGRIPNYSEKRKGKRK